MEKEHPIETVLEQTLSKLKSIIDIDSVIGSPIFTEAGETIIPLSKVSVGFVAGGGEYVERDKKQKTDTTLPFAGGSGGGFNVSPIGFLVVSKNSARIINLEENSPLSKAYDLLLGLYNSYKKD